RGRPGENRLLNRVQSDPSAPAPRIDIGQVAVMNGDDAAWETVEHRLGENIRIADGKERVGAERLQQGGVLAVEFFPFAEIPRDSARGSRDDAGDVKQLAAAAILEQPVDAGGAVRREKADAHDQTGSGSSSSSSMTSSAIGSSPASHRTTSYIAMTASASCGGILRTATPAWEMIVSPLCTGSVRLSSATSLRAPQKSVTAMFPRTSIMRPGTPRHIGAPPV